MKATDYYLTSSQVDRIGFDEMVEQYAQQMLAALDTEFALSQDPSSYADLAWEQFEIGLDEGNPAVDDPDEAKARFLEAFQQAAWEWQKGKIEDMFYLGETGDVRFLAVIPGGTLNGLDYGATGVEVVVLDDDGDQVAYRTVSDALNGDWEIGTLEDVLREMQQLHRPAD